MSAPTRDIKVIELTGWQHSIAYTPLHPNYGRAEFQVCPIWKRGRIVECWVYPRQQVRDEGDVCWHFEANSDGLTVGDALLNTDEPKLWRIGWCRDHKTATYSIYVPDYTNTLEIMVMSSLSLRFVRRKAKS